MANIAFPTVVLSTADISLTWPGQAIHTSLYTNERQVIERGVGVWEGSIGWAVRSRANQDAEIRAIEVFLHQAIGAANTFDVPMPVNQAGRFADGTVVRVTAQTRVGSTMSLTLNQQTGLLVGDYITIDNMLFQAVSNLAGGMVTVTPYRPLAIPENGSLVVNWASPTLRARRTDAGSVSNPKEFDWAGPWSIQITGD